MPSKNQKKGKWSEQNKEDNMLKNDRFEKRSKQIPAMKHPRQSGRGRGK